jgi:hypothetical protein
MTGNMEHSRPSTPPPGPFWAKFPDGRQYGQNVLAEYNRRTGDQYEQVVSHRAGSLYVVMVCNPICTAQSVGSDEVDRCKNPVVLEVRASATGALYRLDGQSFSNYPLDEMGADLRGCKVARTVSVILDYRVSLADLLGSVPSKLQAESVRYFIRTESGLVEISIVSWDARVPNAQ